MTGRRRFNCISNEMEMQLGKHTYDMTVQEYRGRFLPESHHLVRYVDDIFRKLIFSGQPQLGEGDEMLKKLKWKVHVIDSPEMNAFVLPGYVYMYIYMLSHILHDTFLLIPSYCLAVETSSSSRVSCPSAEIKTVSPPSWAMRSHTSSPTTRPSV